MRDKVSLLAVLGLVLAGAGCQESGDSAPASAPIKSARDAVGAAPAFKSPRAAGADLSEVPTYSAYLAAPPVAPVLGKDAVKAVQSRMTRKAPGVVASVDARRPVPTFLFAGGGRSTARKLGALGRADQAAMVYLDQYRSVYDLDGRAVASAEVAGVHTTGKNGQIVQLRQRVDSRDVFGTRMSFVLDKQLDLVAISGHLQSNASARWASRIDRRAALARVLADVTGGSVSESALADAGEDEDRRAASFAGASAAPFHLPQNARVREVFYPMPKQLVSAYAVSVEVAAASSTNSRAYEYVVAADDGRVLERHNRTFSEARTYQVWADGADLGFRPADGPHADLTPHPTGDPSTPIEIVGDQARSLLTVEGLNTNPDGVSDPWLPDGAANLRLGNNISAYADHRAPDGFSSGDPIAPQNPAGAFAYNYSSTLGPFARATQIRTAITQLFFVNNWLHDWYYDSGFTEAAGNAQLDNFGRGGAAGDPLLAEAQDTRGGTRNNANMSTPPDGLSPRMQMYVFDGPITPIGETTFEITAPPDLAGEYPVQASSFGVDDLVTADGNLALIDDGQAPEGGSLNDGCEPYDVGANVFAVVRRGFCSFELKAQNAEAAGAVALLVVNNNAQNPDELPPMGGSDLTIGIPAVGISLANGEAIIAGLGETVSADVTRAGRLRSLDRDGTLDNAIVAHEWGHYLHHRLTLCFTLQCGGMSEGWGDFVALHMMLREEDDRHAVYGAAAWATDDAYFGIRRVPYSVEFDRNALTFGHIADAAVLPDTHPIQVFGPNSEVHNAGEVWASMLWEVYISLIEAEPALSFAEGQRRMSDYIVGGMLMAPVNPTFTEQRDSILAAVAAGGDARDLRVVAEAFARRGAGTGAVSPALDSFDNNDVQENFVVAGNLAVGGAELALDEDCDEDTNLDGGESARLQITIVNSGPIPLTDTTVTVDEVEGVSFPDGASVAIPELAAYQSADVEVAVEVDGELTGIQSLRFNVTAANDGSFNPTVTGELVQRVNFDDNGESAKVDDVESKLSPWEPTTDLEALGWLRAFADDNTVWHADDPGVPGEQSLTSPAVTVGKDPFVVRFDHRHRFEASDEGTDEAIYWDGGVIEFTTDGGTTWADVSTVTEPGYGGELFLGADNPFGGQQAFVAANEGYPEMVEGVLDFGTQFAGQTVQLRFRLGSDISTGDVGWDIDNLSFEGIEGSPFPVVVDDEGSCGSTDDGADDGADDGDGPGDGSGDDDDSGCGCRSSSNSSPFGLLIYAAVLLPFLRRRRRA